MDDRNSLDRVAKTRPLEILLVEDGWTDAKLTIHAIRRCGVHHRLTLVRRLDEARAFLRRTGVFARAPEVHLMLLDLMLPDGSGLSLMDPDERSAWPGRPTTVVLTASEDEALIQRCGDAGVVELLRKPVREEGFLSLVRRHQKLRLLAEAAPSRRELNIGPTAAVPVTTDN